MIKSLAIIFCVAVGVQSFEFNPQVFNGSCPNIVPESVEGVEGRWYTIYSSYSAMQNILCYYEEVISLGNDTFQINSVLDLIKGESIHLTSTVEKEDDGKYYYIYERNADVVEKGLIMVKVEGDFLLSWSCVDYGNGTHTDVASIYSKNKETSEDAKKSFLEYLADKGSQVTEFYEVPHENCTG